MIIGNRKKSGLILRVIALVTVALVSAGCRGVPWEVNDGFELEGGIVIPVDTERRVLSIQGFTDDGRLVAWSEDGWTLLVIDPKTGLVLYEVTIGRPSLPMGFHRNGTVAIMGSRMIEVWRVSGGRPQRSFGWKDGRYTGNLTLSQNGKLVAFGDYALEVWDTVEGFKRFEVKLPPADGVAHSRSVQSVGFRPDGKVVFASGVWKDETEIFGWSTDDGKLLWRWKLDTPNGCSAGVLALSADGKTAAVVKSRRLPMPPGYRGLPKLERRVWLLSTSTGKCIREIEGNCTVSEDGRYVVEWVVEKREARVYDLSSGKRLYTVGANGEPKLGIGVMMAKVNRKTETGNEADIVVWELATGKVKWRLPMPYPYVSLASPSPDGRMAAVGGLTVLSCGRTGPVLKLRPKKRRAWGRSFYGATFSRDSKYLAFIQGGAVGIAHLPAIIARATPRETTLESWQFGSACITVGMSKEEFLEQVKRAEGDQHSARMDIQSGAWFLTYTPPNSKYLGGGSSTTVKVIFRDGRVHKIVVLPHTAGSPAGGGNR